MISERALELESHLYEAFGVAELLATAKTAETLAREAERTRKALHAATKEHLEDRASKEAELAKLIPRLEHLEEDRARVRHRAELAEGALREAHEAKARAAEKERYENRVAALLAEAHALRVSDLEDVGESLDHAKASFAVWLTRARERVERDEGLLAESQGRVGLARAALNQLDGHIARCPVCLRDLGEAELARSRDLQSEALRDATASLSELQQSLAALQGDVASVSALLSQLASLSPPAAQATPAIEVTTAQHERTEALDALEKHHQEQGALRSRVESLQRELAEDDANAERERARRGLSPRGDRAHNGGRASGGRGKRDRVAHSTHRRRGPKAMAAALRGGPPTPSRWVDRSRGSSGGDRVERHERWGESLGACTHPPSSRCIIDEVAVHLVRRATGAPGSSAPSLGRDDTGHGGLGWPCRAVAGHDVREHARTPTRRRHGARCPRQRPGVHR